MIITCNKCSTRFNLHDSLVLEGGSKCRCTVCKNIFTAYPLSRQPETEPTEAGQSETEQPELGQSETGQSGAGQTEIGQSETVQSEAGELEPDFEESSNLDFESGLDFEESSDLDFESSLDFESGLDDANLFEKNSDLESDLEMEDLALSSKDSDFDIENPYQNTDKNEIEIDDDFSFDEKSFDMEEKTQPQTSDVQKNYPESKDKNIEREDGEIEFEAIEFEDDDFEFEPVEEDLISVDKTAAVPGEKDESENEELIFAPDLEMADKKEPPVTPEKNFPEFSEFTEEDSPEFSDDDEYIEKETEIENDLPEQEDREFYPQPKKEKKIILKPKPMADERSEPIKKKKISFFKIVFIILMLIFILALGAYIASVITGYKLPDIEQYLKKPAPEISEAKPIPNQKSVNGRFVTNSTAGTLFVITGRVENPSNIAYSHIEVRGALITTNKAEAKTKNAFCGNIIPEDMLKTGNITDIDILLTLKNGAHKINVNVAPGASVPFMVVFSDLPEKLENFTVKVAGFDKTTNNS